MSVRRRVLIGLILFLALFGLIVSIPIACLSRRAPPPTPVVLRFDVPSQINECELPGRSFPFAALRGTNPTLFEIERAIRHAAVDDDVRALVLHIDGIDWGWAKIAEMREAVRAFRRTGKPVYADLSAGGEREYLLASAAGRICSPPPRCSSAARSTSSGSSRTSAMPGSTNPRSSRTRATTCPRRRARRSTRCSTMTTGSWSTRSRRPAT